MTFRGLRRRAGFSQHALALCTTPRVKQETISQIERGCVRNPRTSTLGALAAALGTTMEEVAAAIRNTRRAA